MRCFCSKKTGVVNLQHSGSSSERREIEKKRENFVSSESKNYDRLLLSNLPLFHVFFVSLPLSLPLAPLFSRFPSSLFFFSGFRSSFYHHPLCLISAFYFSSIPHHPFYLFLSESLLSPLSVSHVPAMPWISHLYREKHWR